ncbi:MAG TPA: hypothetical protein VFV66_11520 [Nonomuraea sp.]|nr:hypothetical protein [Nonomuraea sp.]
MRKVIVGDFRPSSPDPATLIAIENALVEANNYFVARKYQDALQAYTRAERLIFAHLDAAVAGGTPPVITWKPSRAPHLFQPLLSAATEWLNVLPVHEPVATVRPRMAVDTDLLGAGREAEAVKLTSSRLADPPSVGAAADWRLARTYALQGNVRAAEVFAQRAREADPDLAGSLDEAASDGGSVEHGVQVAAAGGLSPALAPGTLANTAVVTPCLPALAELLGDRSVGAHVDGQVAVLSWSAGEAVPVEDVTALLYERRVDVTDLASVIRIPWLPHHVAVDLPHSYYYVVPLGRAECYHALGDYQRAESEYLQAADYTYLNKAIEAPYLWLRLAMLYRDWGNARYREDDAASALPIYENLLTITGTAPSSSLYVHPGLGPAADSARTAIAHLDKLIDGTMTADELAVNPALAAVLVEVRQRLVQIEAGLDFWGHWHASVPIWTFDYLQSVAINFAQLAVSAERDVISFLDRMDQSALTQQQLRQSVEQARGEVNAAKAQAKAAAAEASVYAEAVELANQRVEHARANAEEYAAMSALQIQQQALSAQLAGGDNGDIGQLNAYADTMMGVGPMAEFLRTHPGWKLSGSAATLSAAEQLAGARLAQAYEVQSLWRQRDEMVQAAKQAEAEAKAANARKRAADAAVAVANLNLAGAKETLATFDDQFFTPEVWARMGSVMRGIYRRYLHMAIRAARLMQQAYNFETDQALSLIKGDYSTCEVKGLLGADALMADIQTFTYDLITSKAGKPQPLKQTISLAERYGFAFENQLRRTGTMAFETRIDDFDSYYPGTYAGRIQTVEVEIDGIVPPTGISGTLTNSGISFYRTPAPAGAGPAGSGLKRRVQSRETLVLSDFDARNDSLLMPEGHDRMKGIFEGAGLASTWLLELPKAVNDLDYGALTDVRITFYYRARFDPELKEVVKAELAARPGANERMRGFPLRWIYPDAFFHFQDTGTLTIDLRAGDFRRNETTPVITHLGLQIATDGSLPAGGLVIRLSPPGKPATAATTDATGAIVSDATGSPWAALTGGSALGSYSLTMTADDNPALAVGGALDVAPIANIGLILGYSYTPKA